MKQFLSGLAVALLLLSGCSSDSIVQEINDPGRTVFPQGTEQIVLARETESANDSQRPAPGPELKVRLPDAYLPSQAVNINLDLDDTEEQIIAFKQRNDSQDLIRLLVVAFDPIRNSWISAWEGVTSATNTRGFTVFGEDLTGDHNQELVAFGINNDGAQTLDIFRKTNNALGFGLSYAPILSTSADVDIQIRRVERSEAYENMETINAPSFPIVAESRNPESENVFDTIQTTYFWDFPSRRYVAGLVEPIAGTVIEDDQLRDLFAGTEEDFEQFLEGPWYRSSGTDDMMIAYFGPRERTIVFHTGYLQQAFDWDVSTKTIYGRGMRIAAINESIRTVQRLISISVQSLNQIEITVNGANSLGGVYARLTGSLQTAVLQDRDRVALAETRLNGLYRADSGREIVFSSDTFTERVGGDLRTGGFALFHLGNELVLSLKYVDENRLPVGERTYRVDFEESREGERLVRTLALEPGALGIAGFYSTGGQSLTMEQVEIIENDGPQG